MSVWTHVVGAIRLDDFSFIAGERNDAKDIEDFIGPMSTWEEPNDECKLPRGSEGSIEYKVIQNKDDSVIARFDILFYGDLRDYENPEDIAKYFEDLCRDMESSRDLKCCIRDASFHIKTEFNGGEIVMYYNNDTDKLERMK